MTPRQDSDEPEDVETITVRLPRDLANRCRRYVADLKTARTAGQKSPSISALVATLLARELHDKGELHRLEELAKGKP